jgi:hypothetical protein
MLDALLATIGALAVLASIVAKLVWLRGGVSVTEADMADAVAGPEDADGAPVPHFGAVPGERPGRRVNRRAPRMALRKQMPCVSTRTACSAGHYKR